MSESIRMFELVDSFYKGDKRNVLDIGTRNCAMINQFLLHGYSNLTAIDKEYFQIHNCFLNFKRAKKDITKLGNEAYILHDRDDIEVNSKEILQVISVEYQIEWGNYYDSFSFINGSLGDFFTFSTPVKYNIILSSFVFHFFQASEDRRIINKLKALSATNGLIYMKVHNIERVNTVDKSYEIDKSTVKKDGVTWYLFDDARIGIYKSEFELLYENILDDKIELLLKNRAYNA